jgi:tRNA threonylcarbamoyladenosine biosynthesis protein TsaB
MILAIDTATRFLSLALHDGQQLIAEATWRSADNHTVELTPAIDAMLRRAAVTPTDLAAIAVTRGPGSFTGLRIGMSVAKGLALAADPPLPLIGVPTLDVTAAGQPHIVDRLYAVSQAGRGRINACLYTWNEDSWRSAGEPFLTTWEDLGAYLDAPAQIGGEIGEAGRAALASLGERVILSSAAHAFRRAGFLAELAHARLAAGQTDDPATLAPAYLR